MRRRGARFARANFFVVCIPVFPRPLIVHKMKVCMLVNTHTYTHAGGIDCTLCAQSYGDFICNILYIASPCAASLQQPFYIALPYMIHTSHLSPITTVVSFNVAL